MFVDYRFSTKYYGALTSQALLLREPFTHITHDKFVINANEHE